MFWEQGQTRSRTERKARQSAKSFHRDRRDLSNWRCFFVIFTRSVTYCWSTLLSRRVLGGHVCGRSTAAGRRAGWCTAHKNAAGARSRPGLPALPVADGPRPAGRGPASTSGSASRAHQAGLPADRPVDRFPLLQRVRPRSLVLDLVDRSSGRCSPGRCRTLSAGSGSTISRRLEAPFAGAVDFVGSGSARSAAASAAACRRSAPGCRPRRASPAEWAPTPSAAPTRPKPARPIREAVGAAGPAGASDSAGMKSSGSCCAGGSSPADSGRNREEFRSLSEGEFAATCGGSTYSTSPPRAAATTTPSRTWRTPSRTDSGPATRTASQSQAAAKDGHESCPFPVPTPQRCRHAFLPEPSRYPFPGLPRRYDKKAACMGRSSPPDAPPSDPEKTRLVRVAGVGAAHAGETPVRDRSCSSLPVWHSRDCPNWCNGGRGWRRVPKAGEGVVKRAERVTRREFVSAFVTPNSPGLAAFRLQPRPPGPASVARHSSHHDEGSGTAVKCWNRVDTSGCCHAGPIAKTGATGGFVRQCRRVHDRAARIG